MGEPVTNYEGDDILLEAFSSAKECPMLIPRQNCLFADLREARPCNEAKLEFLEGLPPSTLKYMVGVHLECLTEREAEEHGWRLSKCSSGGTTEDE